MYIAELIPGKKIIPRNFGRIFHLTGSKLKDSGDSMVDPIMEPYFINEVQFPKMDYIYVLEKVDGANMGITRIDDKLYPIMRKGYDCRNHFFPNFIRNFATYVEERGDMFMELLANDERICGEWMVKVHTLKYNLPHEPFMVYDMVNNKTRKKKKFSDTVEICDRFGIPMPKLLHEGGAINPLEIINKLGNGHHGCETQAEGCVYRYEREGKFYSMAKFVSTLGEIGEFMNDETMYNTWEVMK